MLNEIRHSILFDLTLVVGLCLATACSADTLGDRKAGQKLYVDGIRADGTLLTARTQGDVSVSGKRAACVNCHRPSGFGTSEGGYFVPPINGPTLLSDRRLDRGRFLLDRFEQAQPSRYRARLSQPHMRKAYTSASLAEALRAGVDPSGQNLDQIMPRYDLSNTDAANVFEYLRNLSATPDPGVTSEEIHFATIVARDASPQDRSAFLATMEAYFDWANKNSGGERSRQGFSPYHQSDLIDAARNWRLHVWELEGKPETWPEQLKSRYQAEPVFAIISGLAHEWGPIADFCDDNGIPALFPNTALPGRKRDGTTFYFNEGLDLEAQGLALFLSQDEEASKRILQIVGQGSLASEPAKIFEQRSKDRGLEVFLARADQRGNLNAPVSTYERIVVWPGDMTEAGLSHLLSFLPEASKVYLSSQILSYLEGGSFAPYRSRLFIVDPREIDVGSHPLSFRVRAWINSRGVSVTNQQLQFQTFYALTLLDAALGRLKTDFFRAYLIESVEHEAEGDLNPGVFPSLSLGPGQRVGSHGMFVVQLAEGKDNSVRSVGKWMLP